MTRIDDQIATTCVCGSTFRVKAKAEGRKVPCPKCKTPVLIQRDVSDPEKSVADAPEEAATELDFGDDAFDDLDSATPPQLPSFGDIATPVSPFVAALPTTGGSTPTTSKISSPSTFPWLTNALLGLLVLVGCFIALLLVSQFLGVSKTATKAARAQWEYQLVSPYDELLETKLDSLGNEGWELVNARRATSEYGSPKYEMIFRRPK